MTRRSCIVLSERPSPGEDAFIIALPVKLDLKIHLWIVHLDERYTNPNGQYAFWLEPRTLLQIQAWKEHDARKRKGNVREVLRIYLEFKNINV